MAVPDWTRVDSGLFHAFHQQWISSLCAALNGGVLPPEYFALPEQNIRGPIPDVLTLKLSAGFGAEIDGGLAVAQSPPRTRLVRLCEADIYAAKADLITVRHRHGDVARQAPDSGGLRRGTAQGGLSRITCRGRHTPQHAPVFDA